MIGLKGIGILGLGAGLIAGSVVIGSITKNIKQAGAASAELRITRNIAQDNAKINTGLQEELVLASQREHDAVEKIELVEAEADARISEVNYSARMEIESLISQNAKTEEDAAAQIAKIRADTKREIDAIIAEIDLKTAVCPWTCRLPWLEGSS